MTPKIIKLSDGIEAHLYARWIGDPDAAMAEAERLAWSDEVVTMYGRPCTVLRKTVGYGLDYGYNVTSKASIPWEPLPLRIKERLEQEFGIEWQQCACNLYISEGAYIGPHHDKYAVIEGERREPIYVASISLGVERTMVMIPPGVPLRSVPTTVTGLLNVPGAVRIDLPSGSLLIFSNSLNRTWKHSIPKGHKGSGGKRISLTYRHF